MRFIPNQTLNFNHISTSISLDSHPWKNLETLLCTKYEAARSKIIFFFLALPRDVVMVYAWKERQKFEILMKIILWDIEKVKTEMIKPQTTTTTTITRCSYFMNFFIFCVNDEKKTFLSFIPHCSFLWSCLFIFWAMTVFKVLSFGIFNTFIFASHFDGFLRKSSTLNLLRKKNHDLV